QQFQVHPLGFAAHRDVQALGHKFDTFRRDFPRHAVLFAHFVGVYRHAPVGVSLDRFALLISFSRIIHGVDQGKITVIFHRAFKYAGGVVELVGIHTVRYEARRGDGDDQRLFTRTARGFDNVPHRAGWVGMQLVDQAVMDVQAVHAFAVFAQRLQPATVARAHYAVGVWAHQAAELGRLFQHGQRGVVQLFGLVALCGG